MTVATGGIRAAAVAAGDLLILFAAILCVPLVILVLGSPVALLIQLLLRLGGLL